MVDVSHEQWDVQRDAVMETLDHLGAGGKQCLTVFNKIDLLPDLAEARRLVAEFPNSVAISASTGLGMNDLLAAIVRMVREHLGFIRALLPYDKSGLVDECYRYGRVLKADYTDDGILIEAELVADLRHKLEPYLVD